MSPRAELDVALDAAQLASKHLLQEYERFQVIPDAPADISTDADRQAQEIILQSIRRAFPRDGLCAEEATPTLHEAISIGERVWIVDPIDGTRGYLAGREDWCISVALVEDAAPLLGAVFAPVSDEFFFAARGQGATRNDVRLQATAGIEMDFSRVAGPKPLVERLNLTSGDIVLHPRIASLALRLCRVAQGSLDAAFAGGQSHDWDLAAADLIVQEANGIMTALSGDAILYNRREVAHGLLVAAGRDRHASIISRFRHRSLS